MDWNAQTVKTYDDSAKALAKYFKEVGPRVADIERALKLAGTDSKKARVVEIGCGDGRDAAEIVKRVTWYEGFDPSEGLLKLARQKLPDISFIKADALAYHYPANIDVIYAFASLLHVNKSDIAEVFKKTAQSLRSGGIMYISLKEGEVYTEKLKKDEHGERMFYLYSPVIIKEIAHDSFLAVYGGSQQIGSTHWFTIALKRK